MKKFMSLNKFCSFTLPNFKLAHKCKLLKNKTYSSFLETKIMWSYTIIYEIII